MIGIVPNFSRWIPIFLLAFMVFRCTPIEVLFDQKSPRESYIQSIQNTPVGKTKIWKTWLSAGDSSLLIPLPVSISFQQKILYFPDDPDAWSWQLNIHKGRKVVFKCVPIDSSHQLFMDIYVIHAQDTTLIGATTDSVINYLPDEDEVVICRIQPELLIAGSATISFSDEPVLGFPVEGGAVNDIGSFWGDPRDGGRRMHKGVDIFAPRGTPAIAADEGRVRRLGNGGLGGKTVWLRTRTGSLYYAHLDSINVRFGQSVPLGDTIGFVGNTGNARTTPPHLHFGIYRNGATNPFPFIGPPSDSPTPINMSISLENRWGRIDASVANVRPLPSIQNEPVQTLSNHQLVKIRGGVKDWYEIILPNGNNAYIHQSLVNTRIFPVSDFNSKKGDIIYLTSVGQPFLSILSPGTTIPRYGHYGNRMVSKYKGNWVLVSRQE